MAVKPQDIAALVELFNASQWDELHVEIDGLHLFLSTDPDARLTTGAAPERAPSPVLEAKLLGAPVSSAAKAEPQAKSEEPATGEVPSNWVAITAPNLGTFYRAPKPGAAPFVEPGQKVDAETEICLLEVMKLFTTVKAGVSGTIRRVCVKDAEMVEHGQTLFYVEA